MPTQAEIHPSWRVGTDEIGCTPGIDPVSCKSLCDTTSQRSVRIRLTIENGNGNQVEQISPVSPGRQLQEIVGADQPDEAAISVAFQSFNRIHSILRTKLSFQIRDKKFRVARRNIPCRCHAGCETGHIGPGFQRILRGDQPPDLVEIEPFRRFQADAAVTVMGRIEGAAQQADAACAMARTMIRFHADDRLI